MDNRRLNQITRKLDAHTIDVPDELWTRVEAGIDARRRTEERRKVFTWISAAAVVAMLLTAGLVILWPVSVDFDAVSVAENTELEHRHPATHTPDQSPLTVTHHSMTAVNTEPSGRQDTPLSPTSIPTDCNTDAYTADTDRTTHEQPSSTDKYTANRNRSQHIPTMTDDSDHESFGIIRQASRNRPRMSFGLYASNVPSSGHTNGDAGYLVKSIILRDTPPVIGSGNDCQSETAGVFMSASDRLPQTRTDHKLPVRAGLSASYEFAPRWTVETGMSYTYLASDISYETTDSRYETHQSLHYIGIPIKVGYSLWSTGALTTYATAGGMIEKCVSGHSDTRYFIEGKPSTAERMRVIDRPIQWSVNGAAGIRLRIVDRLSLYVEPGISYYFNNGSPVETIYKDRPLNFNLSIGFNYSFSR